MPLQKLEKGQWFGFFARISKELIGKQAEIEIASAQIGAQLEARWLPLFGVAYDPKNDVIEIALDGLDHMVFHPREFYVDYGITGIESLGIVDQNSVWQIVLLRDPLRLPAPGR